MDRLDRIFTLHRILKTSRYPVSRQRLAEELECSESTVYRVRNALESHFGGSGGQYEVPRDCLSVQSTCSDTPPSESLIRSEQNAASDIPFLFCCFLVRFGVLRRCGLSGIGRAPFLAGFLTFRRLCVRVGVDPVTGRPATLGQMQEHAQQVSQIDSIY